MKRLLKLLVFLQGFAVGIVKAALGWPGHNSLTDPHIGLPVRPVVPKVKSVSSLHKPLAVPSVPGQRSTATKGRRDSEGSTASGGPVGGMSLGPTANTPATSVPPR